MRTAMYPCSLTEDRQTRVLYFTKIGGSVNLSYLTPPRPSAACPSPFTLLLLAKESGGGGPSDFFKNRYKRQNVGKGGSGLAPGWDAAPEGSQGGVGGAGVGEVLTPAESSLLKTLRAAEAAVGGGGGAGGGKGGVAGVEGLDRLMRVMINAPDVS